MRVLATHSLRQFPLHFPSRASPCTTRFRTSSTSIPLYINRLKMSFVTFRLSFFFLSFNTFSLLSSKRTNTLHTPFATFRSFGLSANLTAVRVLYHAFFASPYFKMGQYLFNSYFHLNVLVSAIEEHFFFHSCTVHLDTIKVFIYQLMPKRVALKEY